MNKAERLMQAAFQRCNPGALSPEELTKLTVTVLIGCPCGVQGLKCPWLALGLKFEEGAKKDA